MLETIPSFRARIWRRWGQAIIVFGTQERRHAGNSSHRIAAALSPWMDEAKFHCIVSRVILQRIFDFDPATVVDNGQSELSGLLPLFVYVCLDSQHRVATESNTVAACTPLFLPPCCRAHQVPCTSMSARDLKADELLTSLFI